MLHLTLTAAFIAVPHALRDLHGIDVSRHWLFYLCVFAASVALTVPLMLWSERTRKSGMAARVGGIALATALAALVWAKAHFGGFAAALVLYFGAFNFLEARLPAALTETSRGGSPRRGARRIRDLPVRRRVCRRRPGRRPARKPLATHGNICLFGHRRPGLVALVSGTRNASIGRD